LLLLLLLFLLPRIIVVWFRPGCCLTTQWCLDLDLVLTEPLMTTLPLLLPPLLLLLLLRQEHYP
jgi:hypothetical protein